MAEAAQGQATEQPAQQPLPDNLNEFEAVGILQKVIEQTEDTVDPSPKPRDEKGRFTKEETEVKEEAKSEEAQEEAKEEPEEAVEEVKEEETPQPKKYKLKYKGEEREHEEPEVIELAQKGYDYTQKMQAIAKERDELSAKAKADIENAQKDYLTKLETYKKIVEKVAGVEQVDLNKLAHEDPARAQLEFFKQIQFQQTLQALENEIGQAKQAAEAKSREQYQKQAREAVEKLQERVHGWNNDLYGKILKAAVDHYGFQQQEVNAITDHRAIEVLNDARQWREYQAAKPKTVEKRVAAVPKVQKPGTTEKGNPSADRLKSSMARLDKSGSRDDAVDIVRQMIETGRL